MTLYEIDLEIKNFIDSLVVNEDGEIVDVDPTRLEALNREREQKLESIACYIKNLRVDSAAFKAEIDSLSARKKVTDNKIEHLKKLLSDSILNAGDTEFKTAKCSVTFRGSDSVKFIDNDVSLVDHKYGKEEVVFTPDKDLIKEALKNGEEVRGAYLVHSQNIQIR